MIKTKKKTKTKNEWPATIKFNLDHTVYIVIIIYLYGSDVSSLVSFWMYLDKGYFSLSLVG